MVLEVYEGCPVSPACADAPERAASQARLCGCLRCGIHVVTGSGSCSQTMIDIVTDEPRRERLACAHSTDTA